MSIQFYAVIWWFAIQDVYMYELNFYWVEVCILVLWSFNSTSVDMLMSATPNFHTNTSAEKLLESEVPVPLCGANWLWLFSVPQYTAVVRSYMDGGDDNWGLLSYALMERSISVTAVLTLHWFQWIHWQFKTTRNYVISPAHHKNLMWQLPVQKLPTFQFAISWDQLFQFLLDFCSPYLKKPW